MLRVTCPPLPDELQAYLDEQGKRQSPWNSLSGSRAAGQIKACLRQAFHDKCGYCERIEAQTVDHFWPQSDPGQRWVWDNLILACDVCQSKKLDRLPTDDQGHQMVNPRLDEPLQFLYFEYETGIVVPLPASQEAEARGRVTIERLAFDRRPMLAEARRCKLWDVLGHIVRIVRPTSVEDAEEAWSQLVDHLQPTAPYLGIIRQLVLKPNHYTPLVTELRRVHQEFDQLINTWCLPLPGG